jgi:hypothetical protein
MRSRCLDRRSSRSGNTLPACRIIEQIGGDRHQDAAWDRDSGDAGDALEHDG